MRDEVVSPRSLIGRKVVQIRRVRFVFDDQVRSKEGGPLEITFDDSEVVLLGVAPDGEQLAATASAWVDPFAPPLAVENSDFVRRHGKWTAFDISAEPKFSSIIGTAALMAGEVRNTQGRIVGVELTFAGAILRAVVDSDELVVDVVA